MPFDPSTAVAEGTFDPSSATAIPKASNWYAPLDIAASLGTRFLTAPLTPLAGLAGLAGTMFPGPEGQGSRWVKKTSEAIDRLNMDPKTGAGETTLEALRYPLRKYGELSQSVGEGAEDKARANGGNPVLAGTAAQTLMDMLPVALGGVAGGRMRLASQEAKSLNSVADETLRQTKQAGIVLPPSATPGGNFLTNFLEDVGGKAAIKQDATNLNSPKVTALATQDAGVPANIAITPEVLRAARERAAAPYREARAIDPAVAQMVDDLQTARLDVKDARRKYEGPNGGPEERRAFEQAQRRVANLEQQIETAALNAGRPGLVDQIRAARTQIAKIHMAEEGLNRSTGRVSAAPYGDAYADGQKLTGPSERIGRIYGAYSDYMGDPVPAAGRSALRTMGAAQLGATASQHGAAPGILAAGIPFLAGPVRSALLSAPSQALFARPSLYLPSLLPSDPYLASILASGLLNRE